MVLTIIGCTVDMGFVILRVHEDGLWGAIHKYARSVRRTWNWLRRAESYDNSSSFDASDIVFGAILFIGNTYSNLVAYYVNQLCVCLAFMYVSVATKGISIPSDKVTIA